MECLISEESCHFFPMQCVSRDITCLVSTLLLFPVILIYDLFIFAPPCCRLLQHLRIKSVFSLLPFGCDSNLELRLV